MTHDEVAIFERVRRERDEARAALRELLRAWHATSYACTDRLDAALRDAERCLPEYQEAQR